MDQGTVALVELGQLGIEPFKNLSMMIPSAVIDRYEAHAVFNQASGKQSTLSKLMAAILIPRLGLFAIHRKRRLGLWREDHFGGLTAEFVIRFELVVALDPIGKLTDGGKQGLATFEDFRGSALGRGKIANSVVGIVGVSRFERFTTPTQPNAFPQLPCERRIARHRHIRGYCAMESCLVSDDGTDRRVISKGCAEAT